MSHGSFFSGYRDVDNDPRSDALLGFLDGYATLEPAKAHKRAATAALRLKPGDRVLDLGCGTGVDLPAMAEAVMPGGSVTGVDFSRRAVDAARQLVDGVAGAYVVVGDAHELPFADGSFDACRADRTLQHLERPDAALAELKRVLATGGRLVVLEVITEIAPLGGGGDELGPATGELWATERERHGWLPLMLPLLLARAGFAGVTIDVSETSSRDPSVVAAMVEARRGAVRADDDGRKRFDRLHAAAVGGRLRLTMRGVRLHASAGEPA